MPEDAPRFLRPGAVERLFTQAFGVLVGWGLGLSHNYLVEVRGRRTGRVYATPVDLLELRERRFLVAGRGATQWVRNAEAAGELALRKGWRRRTFTVTAIPNDQKPEILKAYLDRFRLTVQRYFPVPAGSPPSAFVDVAGRYPVFELREPPPATPGGRPAPPTGARA